MKTRVKDLAGGFSFQYAEGKRPAERDWHFVGGHAAPATWPTSSARDRARGCFTSRRTVKAALADMRRFGLTTQETTHG